MIRAAAVHAVLLQHHGAQDWWPAADRFEIIVGALLVQRTSWSNVETAIDRLKECSLLNVSAMRRAATADIESCIRCVGFFRAKARRLQALARFLYDAGGLDVLDQSTTASLRQRLLDLDGVGAETADAILLYAFERPAVVVDAYLRRLVLRLSGAATIDDSELRTWVERDFADDAPGLNELHALVVEHGKHTCRKAPRCEACGIRTSCGVGLKDSDA